MLIGRGAGRFFESQRKPWRRSTSKGNWHHLATSDSGLQMTKTISVSEQGRYFRSRCMPSYIDGLCPYSLNLRPEKKVDKGVLMKDEQLIGSWRNGQCLASVETV